ncbi:MULTISPECIES: response regulator [unclassified Bradyrhizobium]|uniref:response regulator n=1 Tax=unclassified Bradyrhizobium TaxID=2631580 RepID=UPI0032E479CC
MLVVEDDPIIAVDLEDAILGFGSTRVRTARTLQQALQLITDHAPQFAVLDIGLHGGEKTFAVAERLDVLGIPYCFLTGYGAETNLPGRFARRPRLIKPYMRDQLLAILQEQRQRAPS